VRYLKPLTFVLCISPLVLLTFEAFTDRLSANPIDDITDTTGTWTLRLLMITLAVTPLRKVFGWNFLGRVRRMLGLFAFSYGFLHLVTFVWLDQFLDWEAILEDIGKRPFILAGFTGFVCLVPLALTSTAGWVRRLGGHRWRLLHRLVYVAAAAGVVHYFWLVKADVTRPVTYAAILGLLLGYRVVEAVRDRVRKAGGAKTAREADGAKIARGARPADSAGSAASGGSAPPD
jgi:sulfoxide reductase heme-binding subunit YedZ